MAYQESTRSITAIAGTNVTKHRFAVFAADGEVDHAGTAQIVVDGIVGETVSAGSNFPLIVPDGGVAMIELGATLAAGALVATNTSGQAIAHGSTAGDVAMGRLLEGGASGEIVAMQFCLKSIDAGT